MWVHKQTHATYSLSRCHLPCTQLATTVFCQESELVTCCDPQAKCDGGDGCKTGIMEWREQWTTSHSMYMYTTHNLHATWSDPSMQTQNILHYRVLSFVTIFFSTTDQELHACYIYTSSSLTDVVMTACTVQARIARQYITEILHTHTHIRTCTQNMTLRELAIAKYIKYRRYYLWGDTGFGGMFPILNILALGFR